MSVDLKLDVELDVDLKIDVDLDADLNLSASFLVFHSFVPGQPVHSRSLLSVSDYIT